MTDKYVVVYLPVSAWFWVFIVLIRLSFGVYSQTGELNKMSLRQFLTHYPNTLE